MVAGTAVVEDFYINEKTLTLLSELKEHVSLADKSGETQVGSMKALKKSGLLGCITPKEFGGMGKNTIFASRLIEKMATVDPSTAIIFFQHLSVVSRIIEWGTDDQKINYLPILSNGRCIGASAWSEKNGGANKQSISTLANFIDKDQWLVNGVKTFTTGAGQADLYLVLIQTSSEKGDNIYGNTGQSFFLIETNGKGIKTYSNTDLAGMRGSSTGFIELIDVKVGSKNLLGPLGGAPEVISHIRNSGLSLGAVSVGISQAAYSIARDNIMKKGLQEKQSLQLKMVELDILIQAARSLVERSALGNNKNQIALSYQSKIFASEISEKVCRECQQIIGGQGFIRGNTIERFYRDSRAIALMGPVNDLAKEIIGKELVE